MANRRMFSKQVVYSSNFLMMPLSTQALYFHLGMSADDDGYVEHFPVMRMIDARPDELKLLVAKGLIYVFDDKVLVIKDWKENNYIQTDRYRASKYLTIYSVSKTDTTCIQAVSKTDTTCIQAVSKEDTGCIQQNNVSPSETTCIQDVSEMDTQDRIGKDRIGIILSKESSREVSKEIPSYPPEYLQIAKDFQKLKMTTHGNLKSVSQADISKWAEEIRKLVEIDRKTIPEIEKVLSFALTEQFWVDNLISLNKLREKNRNGIMKFEVIQAQYMKREGRKTKWD